MNDDKPDKVIRAFPTLGLPENPMQIEAKGRDIPYCEHPSIRINEHERTVHCAKCNAALDPFNFLLRNAQTIQTAWTSYRMATEKVREVSERISSLMKEEKRLKARVKRLSEKTDEIVDIRGNQ